MVNLASRTIDENKNVLLTHSKKIRKSPIEPNPAIKFNEKIQIREKPLRDAIQHNNLTSFHFIKLLLSIGFLSTFLQFCVLS